MEVVGVSKLILLRDPACEAQGEGFVDPELARQRGPADGRPSAVGAAAKESVGPGLRRGWRDQSGDHQKAATGDRFSAGQLLCLIGTPTPASRATPAVDLDRTGTSPTELARRLGHRRPAANSWLARLVLSASRTSSGLVVRSGD